MNRYSPTERIGVNETEKIFIKDIGWIFRELTIVDVGIDAIVEKVENNEPAGKFIAVQIKTGKGNFHITDKLLTYYVSHIHYNYWLNLNIPIIMVAHIPENGETYWQEISESNLKKNKKNWKLEIPIKQKLCEKSIHRLEKLLSIKNDEKFNIYRGKVDTNELDEILEDVKSISDATECILNINEILNKQTEKTRKYTELLTKYIDAQLTESDFQVKTVYRELAKAINLTAKRTETEIELFAQLYSVSINAYYKIIITIKSLHTKFDDFIQDFEDIRNLPNQIEYAKNSMQNLGRAVNDLPNKLPELKEAKQHYLIVLKLLISELTEAKKNTEIIIEEIFK